MMRYRDHAFHEKSFQFTLPGSSEQCFRCVINILRDTSISGVQRNHALRLMKMLLETPQHFCPQKWMEFLNSTKLICHLINLTLDTYCRDPYTDLAVSMVTSFIMQTKGENILKHFIDKCFDTVHGKRQKDVIHFCLLVIDNVCKLDTGKIRFLMFYGAQVMSELINLMMVTDGLLDKTRIIYVNVLKHVMGVFCEEEGTKWPIRVEDFVLKTVNTLIIWLNDANSCKDFKLMCLQLLQDILQYRPLHRVLISMGSKQTEAGKKPTLLLGLKKILCLKEDELTILATQCLYDIVAGIDDAERFNDIMKTDLTEFVLDCLYSKNAVLLSSVFKCLQSMAARKAFYDKCHGVYSMDACLAALKNALDSDYLGCAEGGLRLLTTLLIYQPENMPLFDCQSWHQCSQIIERVLNVKHSNTLLDIAFECATTFFKPHHLIRPRDFKTLGSLIQTVAKATQHMLSKGSPQTKIMKNVMEIFVAANSFTDSSAADDLCGTTSADIQHFRETLMSLTCELILPWVKENCLCLEDKETLKMYLLIIRNLIQVPAIDSDKTAESARLRESAVFECRDVIASGMVSLVMLRYSSLQLNDPVRKLAGQVLAQVFQTISQTKPMFIFTQNLQMLSSGLSLLDWNPKDAVKLVRSLSHKEDATAVLMVLHMFYDQGYVALDHKGTIDVLYKVASIFRKDIVGNLETQDVQSFVYLHCLSWQMLKDYERNLIKELDEWLLDHLAVHPVQKWIIKDFRLFLWCFGSDRKSLRLGNQLLEYWLVEIVLNSHNHDDKTLHTTPQSIDFEGGKQLLGFDQDNEIIFNELRNNFEFCKSLVNFCLSTQKENHISKMSSQLLILWSQQISSQELSENTNILFHKMLTYTCQVFEGAASFNMENGHQVREYLLPVLCELLNCPLNKNIENVWRFRFRPKTILFVSRLLCAKQYDLFWEKCLQFLSYVCSTLPSQDSRAMLSPILMIEGFPQTLSKVFESRLNSKAFLVLPIFDWLIRNGKDYQGEEVVQLSVEILLWKLGLVLESGSKDNLLQLLILVHVAISNSRNDSCACGPIRFVKESLFFSAEMLDLTDFRRIYIHLQQVLTSNHPDVRLKCVECVEQMMEISHEVCEHIKNEPWNAFLVHSMLQARVDDGLQEADINFCQLLVIRNMEQFWTKMSATNFLKSILNSNLNVNEGMISKIQWLIEKLKMSSVYVDKDLLNDVEMCISKNGEKRVEENCKNAKQ